MNEGLNLSATEFERYFCHYCGCEIFKEGQKQRARTRPKYTKDHVIPRCRVRGKGVNNDASTIVPCCYFCNQDKGDLTIEEYRILLAFRYGHITTDFKFQGEVISTFVPLTEN